MVRAKGKDLFNMLGTVPGTWLSKYIVDAEFVIQVPIGYDGAWRRE